MPSGTGFTWNSPCGVSDCYRSTERFRIEPEISSIHQPCHRNMHSNGRHRTRGFHDSFRNWVDQATANRTENTDFGVPLDMRLEQYGFHARPTTPIRCRKRIEESAARYMSMVFQSNRGASRNLKLIAGDFIRGTCIPNHPLQCGLIHGSECHAMSVNARIQSCFRNMRTSPIDRIQRESLLGVADWIYDSHDGFPCLFRISIFRRGSSHHTSSPVVVLSVCR